MASAAAMCSRRDQARIETVPIFFSTGKDGWVRLMGRMGRRQGFRRAIELEIAGEFDGG